MTEYYHFPTISEIIYLSNNQSGFWRASGSFPMERSGWQHLNPPVSLSLKKYFSIYFVLVLHCCMSSLYLCHAGATLLLQGTSFSLLQPLLLQSMGSRVQPLVVAHGFSCSGACGIFLDQELNPCLLHWQVDSYPLSHQGSPHHPSVSSVSLNHTNKQKGTCASPRALSMRFSYQTTWSSLQSRSNYRKYWKLKNIVKNTKMKMKTTDCREPHRINLFNK